MWKAPNVHLNATCLKLTALFAATLLVVGAGSFFATRYYMDDDKGLAVAEPSTDVPDQPLSAEEKNHLVQLDATKQRFYGEIGDFKIIPYAVQQQLPQEEWLQQIPCASPLIGGIDQKIEVPLDAELYYGWPASVRDAGGGSASACSADGRIIFFQREGFVANGSVSVLRGYFLTPKPRFYPNVPEDRFELATVSGKPALIVRPIPQLNGVDLFIIERFPSAGQAGVFLEVHGLQFGMSESDEVKLTLDLAAQILAQYGVLSESASSDYHGYVRYFHTTQVPQSYHGIWAQPSSHLVLVGSGIHMARWALVLKPEFLAHSSGVFRSKRNLL